MICISCLYRYAVSILSCFLLLILYTKWIKPTFSFKVYCHNSKNQEGKKLRKGRNKLTWKTRKWKVQYNFKRHSTKFISQMKNINQFYNKKYLTMSKLKIIIIFLILMMKTTWSSLTFDAYWVNFEFSSCGHYFCNWIS